MEKLARGNALQMEYIMVYTTEHREAITVATTAKLFRNGRSQAVRLPAEFRFEGKEVFIRKDEKTGDVILSKRPDSWDEFFRIRDAAVQADPQAFAEFMTERKDEPPQKREMFG